MYHFARQIIIAAHNGICLRYNIHMLIDICPGKFRFPAICMHRIQDRHLIILHDLAKALFHHGNVAVHGRASQHQHISAGQTVFQQCLSHHGAYSFVVKRDIQVNICILQQSVISNDLNAGIFRPLHFLC